MPCHPDVGVLFFQTFLPKSAMTLGRAQPMLSPLTTRKNGIASGDDLK
jgi:hypothetical protein